MGTSPAARPLVVKGGYRPPLYSLIVYGCRGGRREAWALKEHSRLNRVGEGSPYGSAPAGRWHLSLAAAPLFSLSHCLWSTSGLVRVVTIRVVELLVSLLLIFRVAGGPVPPGPRRSYNCRDASFERVFNRAFNKSRRYLGLLAAIFHLGDSAANGAMNILRHHIAAETVLSIAIRKPREPSLTGTTLMYCLVTYTFVQFRGEDTVNAPDIGALPGHCPITGRVFGGGTWRG